MSKGNKDLSTLGNNFPDNLILIISIILLFFAGGLFAFFQFSSLDEIKSFLIGQKQEVTRKKEIEVYSEISGYNATFQNKQLLDQFLDQVGFWEEDGVRIYGEESAKTVNKLKIYFTDTPQKYGKLISNEELIMSINHNYNYNNDTLEIYLHYYDSDKLLNPQDCNWLTFYGLLLTSKQGAQEIRNTLPTNILQSYFNNHPELETTPIIKISKQTGINLFDWLLDKLIKKVYAECRGKFTCGTDQTTCRCSETDEICNGNDSDCFGSSNTCECTTSCEGDAQFNCVDRRNSTTLCPNEGGCGIGYDCVVTYDCYWYDPPPPDATATPTPEPPSDGSCDQDCGTCGFRDSDGNCTTDWYCCYRRCNNSGECITVYGPGNSDECDDHDDCYDEVTDPPGSPTNLQVQCHNPGDTATLSWDEVDGADSYNVRVDDNDANEDTADVHDGTENNCPSDHTHDICVNGWTSTSMQIDMLCNEDYSWWVHAVNSAGGSDAAYGPYFQCCPNCSNLDGPTELEVDETGTYSVDFESIQGELKGSLEYGNFNQISGQTFSGTTGSISVGWTASSAGTYRLWCRAWNDAIAECRPPDLVDGPPRWPCEGPDYELYVDVIVGWGNIEGLVWWDLNRDGIFQSDETILAAGDFEVTLDPETAGATYSEDGGNDPTYTWEEVDDGETDVTLTATETNTAFSTPTSDNNSATQPVTVLDDGSTVDADFGLYYTSSTVSGTVYDVTENYPDATCADFDDNNVVNIGDIVFDPGGSTGLNSDGTYSITLDYGNLYEFSSGSEDFIEADVHELNKDCSLSNNFYLDPDEYTGEDTLHVGFSQIGEPWYQVIGGDVTAYGSVDDRIASSCANHDQCIPYIATNRYTDSGTWIFEENGVVAANSSIDYHDGEGVGDPNDWQVENGNLWQPTNVGYQYFSALFDDSYQAEPGNLSDISGSVGANQVEIKLIDGNVTADQDLTVAEGGIGFFVISGNLSVDGDVDNLQGIFIVDGNITIQGDTDSGQANLEGVFVADADGNGNGSINAERDRGTENNTAPSATFEYRPDMIVNLLNQDIFIQTLESQMKWEEIKP